MFFICKNPLKNTDGKAIKHQSVSDCAGFRPRDSGRSSRPLGKGVGGLGGAGPSLKTFFRLFRPQFGPKISGGGGVWSPRAPSLVPPLPVMIC